MLFRTFWYFGGLQTARGHVKNITKPQVTFTLVEQVEQEKVTFILTPFQKSRNTLPQSTHIFLRQISTIKSHDGGKEGYFGNHKVNSYHLQSTRSAQPPGQLSL